MWQNSKKQIVTKIKNSNCDKTQKLKLWTNSKTQIVTKLKKKETNCDKTQKLKLWQDPYQIKTKLKNSNCDNIYSDSSDNSSRYSIFLSF